MVKRLITVCWLQLLLVVSTMAVPAHPGTIQVQQPDGSLLTLRLVGDEWLHFNTTEDGYSVVRNAQGFYVYAELEGGRLRATQHVAHNVGERQAAEQAYLLTQQKYQAPAMDEPQQRMKRAMQQRQKQALAARRAQQYDYNNFRGLIVLVAYNDRDFSRADYADYVNDMVNQEGYTGYQKTNGQWVDCTGSVRDYFSDNSNGRFQPQFDVAGPYTVGYSQYDGSNEGINILNDALEQADADVDFSQYDGDGDGFVDLVFFIVAGNGANYSGNDGDLWWPHRSAVYDPSTWNYLVKDNTIIYDYASSTELSGYTSYPYTVQLDGIGTICHEFSHVLGLPDFYDTDYEKSGGESNHPGVWSVMAGGSYENDSHTPVGYSLYERYSVGFMDEPALIEAEGAYELQPLFSSEQGFRINSAVENEFFLFENRQKSDFKWDAYLPGSGMLVHRVDFTSQSVWDMGGYGGNTVNANPQHNYYEMVRAGGSGHSGTSWDVFPGRGGVTELHSATSPASLKSWGGKNTKWGLKNISMQADGTIVFDIVNTFILTDLQLPETFSVQVGLPALLTATLVPDYVDAELTWMSSDEAVATVDATGLVTGLSAGTCTITVMAENGLSASCRLTVEELTPVEVSEFKTLDVDDEVLLQLTDAEVLYVNKKVAYLRDATGPIVFNNIGFTLKRNQVLNGTLFAKVSVEAGMVQAVPISGLTSKDELTFSEVEEVLPREVAFEELTASDYGEYVLLKGVTIETGNGFWVVSGDKRARLWNYFRVSGVKLPTDVEGKTFDVVGLYGTDDVGGELVDEIYLLGSVMETEQVTPVPEPDPDPDPDPDATGVNGVSVAEAVGVFYDLQGRRVAPGTKGVLIHNGRKVYVK